VEPGRFRVQVDTLEQDLTVEGERLSTEVTPALPPSN
jgi:hypothetical protein